MGRLPLVTRVCSPSERSAKRSGPARRRGECSLPAARQVASSKPRPAVSLKLAHAGVTAAERGRGLGVFRTSRGVVGKQVPRWAKSLQPLLTKTAQVGHRCRVDQSGFGENVAMRVAKEMIYCSGLGSIGHGRMDKARLRSQCRGEEAEGWEKEGKMWSEETVLAALAYQTHALSVLIPLGDSREYHYVQRSVTWSEAQRYCREHYVDLATIETKEDWEKVRRIMENADGLVWIGLYDDIYNWRWSIDNSYLYSDGNELGAWFVFENRRTQKCVEIFGGKLYDSSCGDLKNSVCYDVPEIKLFKITLKFKGSVDPNDPLVQEAVLNDVSHSSS
ncbi:L-selectin, partial [Nibea albiflora]